MRMAARAAAWAVWAAWICSRAIAGGAAAGDDWLQSQESGLRPALSCGSNARVPAYFISSCTILPLSLKRSAASGGASRRRTSDGATYLVP
jgi:hypothetical protein